MLTVSEEYIQAILADEVASRVAGIMTLSDGKSYEILDCTNIVKGSLSISNQCVNGSDFEYGAVYCGQLSLTLYLDVDRYKLYGAKIELSHYQKLLDGSEEEIPLGVYYVAEPLKKMKSVQLKCYDAMTFLDVDVEDNTLGTIWDVLTYTVSKCKGIEMAQGKEEIEALPNGETNIVVEPERINTYRDLIAYIATLTATFATIDRGGRLRFVSFAKEPFRRIGHRQQMSITVSDYNTYYDGVKGRFIRKTSYASYSAYSNDKDGGLVMLLRDNPLYRGESAQKKKVLKNILADLEQIRYTPTTASIYPDPSLELGDMVTLEDVSGTGESVDIIITGFTYQPHKAETIKSVGSNPKLAKIKSSTQKQLSGLEAETGAGELTVTTYSNASAYKVGADSVEIILINYATTVDAKPTFLATVQFTMDRDGVVEFAFYKNHVIMDDENRRGYYGRGEHFATLFFTTEDKANTRVTFTVTAKTEYFESDMRQQAAKIKSLVDYAKTGTYGEGAVDTVVPWMNIAQGGILAAINAQGLAGEGQWDGTLEIMESMVGIDLAKFFTLQTIREQIGTKQQEPQRLALEGHVGGFNVGSGLQLPAISDGGAEFCILTDNYDMSYDTSEREQETFTYDVQYVFTENRDFRLKNVYRFRSVEVNIDTGRMAVLKVDLGQFASVESVVVENAGL